MSVEALEDLMQRYGFPHTWDQYVCFINKWRLVCKTIEVRLIIDVALRCPIEELAKQARNKLKDVDLERVDREWPGYGDFTYDWDGLTKAYEAKKERESVRSP